MEINISELMKSSKSTLEGKWGLAIGTFLVFMLLSGGVQATSETYPVMGIVAALIVGPFAVGLSKFSLHIARNEEARFEDSFSGFSNFLNAFLAYLLMLIIVLVGMVLLIVPGIIAAMALSMTFFIMSEDTSISAIDALKKSHAMMNGYKMSYFLLSLRYLALTILCILTLGIGLFWLLPYIYVTNATFYELINEDTSIDILA